MKFYEFKEELINNFNFTDRYNVTNHISDNLRMVLEINRELSKFYSLDELLKMIIEYALQLTASERGFIVLKNEYGNLEFKLCIDSQRNVISSDLFNLSTSVVNDVFYNNSPVFIENAQNIVSKKRSTSIFDLKLETILCAPMTVGDRTIGVIYVDSKKLHDINIETVKDTFEIFAHQAAIAINNVQYRDYQKKSLKKLMEINLKLEEAKLLAEKADRLKTEFLRQISHEVRTPLHIIFAACELLKYQIEPEKNPDMNETFDMIKNAGNEMTKTIDNIVDMAKLQIEDFEINREWFRLSSGILEELIRKYKNLACQKNLELHYDISTGDDLIFADKGMLNKIFASLLDNAIKYTNRGTIDICLYRDENNNLAVRIKDTGIGISPEYLNKIFTPFSQGSTGTSRSHQGMGLDLAIAKKYAELNNAVISVSSKKNVGSIFTVQFKNN